MTRIYGNLNSHLQFRLLFMIPTTFLWFKYCYPSLCLLIWPQIWIDDRADVPCCGFGHVRLQMKKYLDKNLFKLIYFHVNHYLLKRLLCLVAFFVLWNGSWKSTHKSATYWQTASSRVWIRKGFSRGNLKVPV